MVDHMTQNYQQQNPFPTLMSQYQNYYLVELSAKTYDKMELHTITGSKCDILLLALYES